MQDKWVLIVDDEEAILSVLEKSLKKLGSAYHVVTVHDAQAALQELGQRSFDLIITDYKMAGMNGLELLETIRSIRPEARVILMTAYGSYRLESEAQRLKVFRYLTKPLEIDAFRRIVQDALQDEYGRGGSAGAVAQQTGLLVLSDEQYWRLNKLLDQLKGDVGARCIFLTDAEGRFIARTGDVEQLPLEQISSLVGGGIATLLEAGRLIDGETDAINLAYREGKRENLYAINIGCDFLLIIIIDVGEYSSRLGSVWYYSRQTAVNLRQELGQVEYATPKQVFGEAFDQALDNELDKLFDDDSEGDAFGLSSTMPKSITAPDADITTPKKEVDRQAAASEVVQKSAKAEMSDEEMSLLTFDEAVAAGLIPTNVGRLQDRKSLESGKGLRGESE